MTTDDKENNMNDTQDIEKIITVGPLTEKEAATVESMKGPKSGITLQDTAKLHEKAVQAVAKGEVPKKARKARKRAERKQPKVHTHLAAPDFLLEAAQARVNDPENSYTKLKVVPDPDAIAGVAVIIR